MHDKAVFVYGLHSQVDLWASLLARAVITSWDHQQLSKYQNNMAVNFIVPQ